MARLGDERYVPNPANSAVYDELYAEYVRLHDHFGRGGDDAMKRLRAVQRTVIETDAVG
jgi:L-ribulokinase